MLWKQEMWLSKENVHISKNMEYFEYQIDAFGVYPAPSRPQIVPLHCQKFHRDARFAIGKEIYVYPISLQWSIHWMHCWDKESDGRNRIESVLMISSDEKMLIFKVVADSLVGQVLAKPLFLMQGKNKNSILQKVSNKQKY